VTLRGRSVAIFNVDGKLYALRDSCPHRGAPLSCGVLTGGSVSAPTPGHYVYDSTRRLLRCPWHGWEFDLETGQSWIEAQRLRVRSYEVAVEAGEALLDANIELADISEGSSMVPGPYRAETFDISVDGAYVVVDI
jgi:3-phenylpropionate/trans-cinnamate dioxygenase ferredoxin subunit